MLATGLLATPRLTGGVGPWTGSNGSGRTRAEFLFCAVFDLRRNLRLPLQIAEAISTVDAGFGLTRVRPINALVSR